MRHWTKEFLGKDGGERRSCNILYNLEVLCPIFINIVDYQSTKRIQSDQQALIFHLINTNKLDYIVLFTNGYTLLYKLIQWQCILSEQTTAE